VPRRGRQENRNLSRRGCRGAGNPRDREQPLRKGVLPRCFPNANQKRGGLLGRGPIAAAPLLGISSIMDLVPKDRNVLGGKSHFLPVPIAESEKKSQAKPSTAKHLTGKRAPSATGRKEFVCSCPPPMCRGVINLPRASVQKSLYGSPLHSNPSPMHGGQTDSPSGPKPQNSRRSP